MDEMRHDEGDELGSSAWIAFGDLLAGVLGAFVLVLAAALIGQLDLAERLQLEQRERQAEQARREKLERALAGPLADGRISLVEGRIGISGALLFAPGSDQLRGEGEALLASLAPVLREHLTQRDEMLMVSGFTDDRALREHRGQPFADNLELSAARAMTVTRALIQAGLPRDAVFAAAFGEQQPVASNANSEGRALNRRVEIAPTPRLTRAAAP
jgi:flagellar motor protein MotB